MSEIKDKDRKTQFKIKVEDAYKRIMKKTMSIPNNQDQAEKLLKQHLEQMKPANEDDAYRLLEDLKHQWSMDSIDLANFVQIKHYLDDDYPGDEFCDKGKNLRVITYAPVNGEDRLFVPKGEPDSPQYVLEALKKYDLIPDDSKISDYSFLFPELSVE